jgi:hypothetical protein
MMYNLNVNSTEFNQRTKSVFDTLGLLEVSHKTKQTEYAESAVIGEEADTEPELNEAIFKVPAIPKRSINESNDFKAPKKLKQTPDFLVNPHKWKKYSLEDVNESQTNQSANYTAAMSFLNSKKMIIDEESEQEVDTQIVFNRPIRNGRKTFKTALRLLTTLDESLESDDAKEESPSKEQKPTVANDSFKKRNRKINKKNCIEEQEQEDNEEEIIKSDLS